MRKRLITGALLGAALFIMGSSAAFASEDNTGDPASNTTIKQTETYSDMNSDLNSDMNMNLNSDVNLTGDNLLQSNSLDENNADNTGEDSDLNSSDQSTSANTNPLSPNEGKAEIIEYEAAGSNTNQVSKLLEEIKKSDPGATASSTNDVPSIQLIEHYNVKTGELIESYYAKEDTGAPVEIDTSLYPLPKNQTKTIEEVAGDVQTKTTTYVSTNAIQKAINKALLHIESNARSVTIRIDAGEYAGDITISNVSQDLQSLNAETFTLYLLAADSFVQAAQKDGLIDKSTINANGSGTAKITGKVKINGVNVVISGILFDTEESISLEEGSLTVWGTKGDDSLSLQTSGSPNVRIMSGNGNDSITLAVSEEAAAVSDPGKSSFLVDTGSGDDSITVDIGLATQTSRIQVNGGEGSDDVKITGTLEKDGSGSRVELTNSSAPILIFKPQGSNNTIDIQTNSVENFTDSLANKKQVVLTSENFKDGKIFLTADQLIFIDYLLDTSRKEGGQYVFTDKEGSVLKDISVSNHEGIF